MKLPCQFKIIFPPIWPAVIAPGTGGCEMNRTASVYQRWELSPLAQVKVITGLFTLGVMVPTVSQVLLVASPGPLLNTILVAGKVVLDTPVAVGLTTILGVSSKGLSLTPQLTETE